MYDICELLLVNGANPNYRVIYYIDDDKLIKYPIHEVVGRNSSYLKLLIKYGVLLETKDMSGKTALHKTAKYNYIESLKILLANGANTNTIDIFGNTPLDLALEYKNHDCVKILQEF